MASLSAFEQTMNAPYDDLLTHIHTWAQELGFQALGVAAADTSAERERLEAWLAANYHGSMAWIEEHKELRLAPEQLVEGASRVISFRMDYLPAQTEQINVLKSPKKAYVSRYALGRDYHKLIRKRLATLGKKIESFCVEHSLTDTIKQRAFVDSAPILERPLAEKSGLGWVGKHTLLINESAGSWFFLGELYTNIPLPINDTVPENHCGDCRACIQVCPTDAFPKPYVLDARRCISYLTIENKGPIPETYREVMGNRVFGCDDCQAICPWNKYAQFTEEQDFKPRHNLENAALTTLFSWSEKTFLDNTAGSPIRRIGYQNWLRNLSVGLGNAPSDPAIIDALQKRLFAFDSDENNFESWLKEQFEWALARQTSPQKRRRRKLKAQEE